jgi:outer membrane protein assembly factor BamB
MNNTTARYVDQTNSRLVSAELSFTGALPTLGNKNPQNTNVVLRILTRVNPHWDASPWVELWTQPEGYLIMPSGAWNGIKLTEVIGERVFFALSNRVVQLDSKTGDQVWSFETGNTPIYWIVKAPDEASMIVFNGYFGFERNDRRGNIASLTLHGAERWRAEVPTGDVYANPPRFKDGKLTAGTWQGFNCTLDPETGIIIEKLFTK